MSVTVVLVSHGGARWLPAVLRGIAEQTHRPDRVVAVDTGSKDESVALLTEALGAAAVTVRGRETSYPAAVALGLEQAPSVTGDEWMWLLHDDSAPAPTALAELLAAAGRDPGAAVLGPKLREWPDLKRLLEVGVTISGTGRRETGLERGEYDQGQHDEVRDVLAVNTAGLLVRREVYEQLGGLDPELAVFGNDLDFGWRAARAGHRTVVVPPAVVFHAEAAHRGARRTPLTGRHTHFQERRAALFTLLANRPARELPWQVLRLLLGSLLRVVGFLVVRSVGEAADELAALVAVLGRPRTVLAARRARHGLDVVHPREVRTLLAPWWLPYRHALDFAGDLTTALGGHAQDVAERRRAAQDPAQPPAQLLAGEERDRDLEEDEYAADSGLVARFLTSPVAIGTALFLVAVLVGSRAAWGRVAGGGLSPTPDRAGELWRLYAESWHPLGLGTDVPAPVYLAPLAALGTLLGDSASAAVSVVLVVAVPMTLWGAWRFLRVLGRLAHPLGAPTWLLAAGAGGYAVVPAVSGAWGAGRLGPVVVAAVLPWLAHAALGFADPEADRRWRAAWRSGLLLTLGAAFAPTLLLCWLVLTLAVYAAAALGSRSLLGDRSVALPPGAALAVPPVLLAPWWVPLVSTGNAAGLLLDPGRLPPVSAGAVDLLLGRLDGGAPWWSALPVLVLAAIALAVPTSRSAATLCWVVAAVAAGTALVVSLPVLDLQVDVVRPGASALLPVLQLALGSAAVLGVLGLVRGPTRARRVVVPLVAALALVAPVSGAVWFAVQGGGTLRADPPADIPAYMGQRSDLGPEHGVLIVRGDVAGGLTYLVRRGDGVTLGEDEVLALTPEDRSFTARVRTLVSRPTPDVVASLARDGIEYVVLPGPADGRVAANLDAAVGLVQASPGTPTTRAWQVEEPLSSAGLGPRDSRLRSALLVLQAVALLVVVVLCGPTVRRRPDEA